MLSRRQIFVNELYSLFIAPINVKLSVKSRRESHNNVEIDFLFVIHEFTGREVRSTSTIAFAFLY